MTDDQDELEPEAPFLHSLLREAFSTEIRNLFFIVSSFIALGTAFYKVVESWSWVDSFYFSVTTLTTVGYGDLAPSTTISKLFTTLFIFSGLGIVLTFLQTIAREQAKEPFFFRIVNRRRNHKNK